jgi:hypothetical protein
VTTASLPVTVLLGAVGLLSAGPLTATLLVGRTGIVPSLRWLGLCLAAWVVLGALGWAAGRGNLRRAALAVAPLAALAVFLPWAYAADQVFHALTRSTGQVLGALGVLALLGAAWQTPATGRLVAPARHAGFSRVSPALLAPVVGLCLMYGLNDAFFEPLGAPPGGPLAPLRFLAGAVPALVVALLVRARLLNPPDVALTASIAGVSGFLAVWLGVTPAGPALFAIAAVGLVAAAHGAFWHGLDRRERGAAAGALVIGLALAATDMAKYGLGARELIAAAPELARLLPALGLLAVACALTLGVVAQTSRSAAMGGTRDA